MNTALRAYSDVLQKQVNSEVGALRGAPLERVAPPKIKL